MTITLTGTDAALIDYAVALLDRIGRRTSRSTVAVHALAAAQLLDSGRPAPPDLDDSNDDERAVLREALRRLAHVSADALRADDIAEAVHQAMLAYLASR